MPCATVNLELGNSDNLRKLPGLPKTKRDTCSNLPAMKRTLKMLCTGSKKYLSESVSIKTVPPSSLEATEKTEPCKQHRVARWHHWGRIYGQSHNCPATLDFFSYFFPFLANEWLPRQAVRFRALFDLHAVIKVVIESYWSLQFFSHWALSLCHGGFMISLSSSWQHWVAFPLFRPLFLIIEIHKS